MGGDSSVLRPEHPSARSLAELVNDFSLDTIGAIDGVEVSGISINTGNLQPGDLYVGVQGVRSHGATYASKAKALGAVALLTDAAGRGDRSRVRDCRSCSSSLRARRSARSRRGSTAPASIHRCCSGSRARTARPPSRTCSTASSASSGWSPVSARPPSAGSASSPSRARSRPLRPPRCTACSHGCARARCAPSRSR